MGKKPKNDPKPEVVNKVKEEVTVEKEGIVDGVEMSLNIRENPEVKDGNVITTLRRGTKIIIVDPDKEVKGSGESWFKIRFKKDNAPQKEGYAMRKFIKVI